MTDRDMNERLLRLNAALDGELDAMASLEFEREMRDDPAIAAEYRRLTALRDAVRRHAPREAAPQALADRIAGLAPPGSTPSDGGRACDCRSAPAAGVVRQARACDGRFVRCPRLCGRRWPYIAAHARALRRRRPTPGLGFRPRRDRRSAVRRCFVRSTHGQALARRPHNRQREHRRSRAGGLPARRRTRRHRRPDPDADARLSPQRARCRGHRAAARREPSARGPAESKRSTAITSHAGRTRASPMSPFPTWTRRRSASSSRRSDAAAAPRPSPPVRDALARRRSQTAVAGKGFGARRRAINEPPRKRAGPSPWKRSDPWEPPCRQESSHFLRKQKVCAIRRLRESGGV